MRDCNWKRGFKRPNICIVTPKCDWHIDFLAMIESLAFIHKNDSTFLLKHVPHTETNKISRPHRQYSFRYTFQQLQVPTI